MSSALARDLRRLLREPLKSKVRLAWVDQRGQACYAQCQGLDVSEKGMRLDSREPVAPRTTVQIQIDSPSFKASATVRWCRQVRVSYQLGLEFVGKAWKVSGDKQKGSL